MRRIWLVSVLLILLPVLASAQPAIVSVDPNSALRGASVGVQITGSQTIFLQGSEVTSVVWLSKSGSRIDASSVNVTDATLLDANFDIPGDALLDLWNVNVEQVVGGPVTLVDGFTILSACAITDLAAGAQTACDPATNTYTQEVVVTYENAPASGTLDVNGQSFAIGSSPQTVTLVSLVSDGATVDVTASFSAEPACSRTEIALFTAPQRCRAGDPPDCSQAEPSIAVLWPPSSMFKNVHIVGVTDPDGDDVTITITGVTSDEPTHGLDAEDLCPDAVIGEGSVDLRAQRDGDGNGRVYTIHFTATDETGDSCDGTVSVCVPHDQRNRRPAGGFGDADCIRDDFQYDATLCPTSKASRPGLEPPAHPVITRAADGQITIVFTIESKEPVDLRIFDLRGRLVRRLASREFPAGRHTLQWDGRNARGLEAANGIYFVRVVISGKAHTSKTMWTR